MCAASLNTIESQWFLPFRVVHFLKPGGTFYVFQSSIFVKTRNVSPGTGMFCTLMVVHVTHVTTSGTPNVP